MDTCPSLAKMLRRWITLTMFGALILALAGPIISLVMMMAMYATVGFIVWLPLQMAFSGRHRWRYPSRERTRQFFRRLKAELDARRGRIKEMVHQIHGVIERRLTLLLEAMAEIFGGTILGILIAVTAGTSGAGVALGALLGCLAGASLAFGRRVSSSY